MFNTCRNMSILYIFLIGCAEHVEIKKEEQIKVCEQDSDCVNESHFCEKYQCQEGECVVTYKDYRTPVPQKFQTRGNCKEIFCSGNPENFGEMEVINDYNVISNINPCIKNSCQEGNFISQNEGEGQHCYTDNGVGRCDGYGKCVPWLPVRCKIDGTEEIFQCPGSNNITDISFRDSQNAVVSCHNNIPENNQYCSIATACMVTLSDGGIVPGHCL